MASGTIPAGFPLVEIFPRPAYCTVYDARRHFALNLSFQQVERLVQLMERPAQRRDRSGSQVAGLVRDGDVYTLPRLLSEGLFAPGPFEETFSTDLQKLEEYVGYCSKYVVTRRFCLEITESCNFRCRYCPHTMATQNRRHTERRMSFRTARNAIDRYFERYVAQASLLSAEKKQRLVTVAPPSLSWYGGEPFLNFAVLVRSHQYFTSLPWADHGIPRSSLRFVVNTNLSILNDAVIRFLAKNDVTTFVSLDGDREDNDRYRIMGNGEGTWDVVTSNLRKLRSAEPTFYAGKVIIQATSCPSHNRKRCQTFLRGMGTKYVQSDMQVPHKFIGDPKSLLQVSRANADKVERVLRTLSRQTINASAKHAVGLILWKTAKTFDGLQTDVPSGSTNLPMRTCPMGYDALMVSTDGKYHMCHKTDGSLPLGDCNTGYDSVRIAAAYQQFHRMLNRDECRSCWAIHFCQLCAAPLLRNGTFTAPTNQECDCVRESVKQSFRILQVQSEHRDVVGQIGGFAPETEGVVTIDSL